MTTIERRPQEDLPTYLVRCAEEADRLQEPVGASFGGTSVVIRPHMTADQIVETWVTAKIRRP